MPALRPPITILVDRREQRPWTWSEPGITTQRATLVSGDYSLAGCADIIAVERKSLNDFVHTVIHDHRRWHAEVIRLTALRAAAVVIEAGLDDLLARRYDGHAHPHAVLGRALSVQLDFGIPITFAGSRPLARLWATAWLLRAARRHAPQEPS